MSSTPERRPKTSKTTSDPVGYTCAMTLSASLDKGRHFVLTEGRLLERRIMATLFEGADAAGALDALAGYRNDDGGFGHGLEPDKRTPRSQPLDVEAAFQVMEAVGRVDETFVLAACDFLMTIGPGVGCLTKAWATNCTSCLGCGGRRSGVGVGHRRRGGRTHPAAVRLAAYAPVRHDTQQNFWRWPWGTRSGIGLAQWAQGIMATGSGGS